MTEFIPENPKYKPGLSQLQLLRWNKGLGMTQTKAFFRRFSWFLI
jgi:hypothetical protein